MYNNIIRIDVNNDATNNLDRTDSMFITLIYAATLALWSLWSWFLYTWLIYWCVYYKPKNRYVRV